MKPQPIVPTRPTSERRAAAARANGAKSRGPVSAIGKANSSRNSHRHGLRSRTLFADFADPESAVQLTALFLVISGGARTCFEERFSWSALPAFAPGGDRPGRRASPNGRTI
jgi:hypothetical protein